MSEQPAFYEEDCSETIRQESDGYTSLVHMRVEDNTIKFIHKLNWRDHMEVIPFIRQLLKEGYLYDDSYEAYVLRSKRGDIPMRDTYQFPNRYTYEWTKSQLGLM